MKGKEQEVFDKALEKDLKKSASEVAKEMEDNGMLQNLDNPLGVDGDNIPNEGYKLNRRERKKRLKHFTGLLEENEVERLKMLKEEDNESDSAAKLENRQARLQAWFIRRVNLERKIAALSDKDTVYGKQD